MSTKTNAQNSIGKRFGRLVVMSLIGYAPDKHMVVECRCDCGNTTVVPLSRLKKANGTKSCGCLIKLANTKHGKRNSRTYPIWLSMKQRCTNPKNKRYSSYGGRGITVCDRWVEFENFLEDMGERPPGLSLERIDNDGNYEPGNCTWTTAKQQARNNRHNHMITYNGTTLPLVAWSEKVNIPYDILKSRLNKLRWPIHKALTTPRCKMKKVV